MKRVALLISALFACQAFLAGHPLPHHSDRNIAEPESPAPSAIIVSTFPTELTIEGLMSLYNGNYPLQMGAFTSRKNAEVLKNKLEEMLNIPVNMVSENGLFKVRLNDFSAARSFYYYIPVVFPFEPEEEGGNERTAPGRKESVPSYTPEETVMTAKADTAPPGTGLAAPVVPDDATGDTITTAGENSSNGDLFFLKGSSPWLNRFNYFGKSVALVNALIFTIIASVATMVILLVVILLNRNRMEKEERLRQYLLEQYQGLIIDYLFGDATPDRFRPIASDLYRRQVLIEQMIDVSVNLKGDAGSKLKKLYLDLNLDRDSIDRARSRRWHLKIKGFRELAFMNIREANAEMYKSLNSGNEILRMEAQIALVRLSETDPFEFLSYLNRPFSLWEQISLHELIVQHEIPVPQFSKWLTSQNTTIVMFALRMIREFKQKEAEPDVMKVLLHRDPEVSHLAIQVAGDLDMRSTLDTMKRMYKYQDYNICLEIVRSMGKMPEMAMMSFLKLVLDKEDDVQLQIEATKAIENMGEEGVKALVKLMKSEYKNYSIIVRHVLDRRIY